MRRRFGAETRHQRPANGQTGCEDKMPRHLLRRKSYKTLAALPDPVRQILERSEKGLSQDDLADILKLVEKLLLIQIELS